MTIEPHSGLQSLRTCRDMAEPNSYGTCTSLVEPSCTNVQLLSNGRPVPAGACSRAQTIEEFAAELERGVAIEAAILAHHGPQCLLRPEYQFGDNGLFSPLTSPAIDLSPYETSPPSSTESPGSVLSQDGPAVFSGTPRTDQSVNSNHNTSRKKFPCHDPSCDYAADRRDHVNDHFRKKHQGILYECDRWCVPNCPLLDH